MHNTGTETAQVVKVGKKQRHLKIPDGWYLVTEGTFHKGDKAANLYEAVWEPIDDEDVGNPLYYDFVIRKRL